jgi:predicted nucleic acid-binding protein
MASVYLETTVISYLAARISSDLVTAAHQRITLDWWASRRLAFELFVSELVHQESRSGNPEAAERRHDVLRDLPSLALTPAVRDLGARLLRESVVPASSTADAVHIAVAAVHGVDYLMTWNLRHIANAQIKWRIERTCVSAGYIAPVVCTPEQLMEEL